MELLSAYHILWFNCDLRKLIVTSDERELEAYKNKPEKIRTPSGDYYYKKPIAVYSYMFLEEALREDRKLWRFNNKAT
jgi:hypothetical protein